MEHLVDLDELASRLGAPAVQWRKQATVGPLTWRDGRASWPQPIVTDRAAVELPESLGIQLSRDTHDELQGVVWAGGWADVIMLLDGEVANRCPEFSDVDDACAAVVRTVEDFLG